MITNDDIYFAIGSLLLLLPFICMHVFVAEGSSRIVYVLMFITFVILLCLYACVCATIVFVLAYA